MLTLYTHPYAIVPWRIRIALHEKGLPHQTVTTNLYTEKPTPEFLALNPFAQIPVLDDDGFILAESIAILEYLEETQPSPTLLPGDHQTRATIRKLMCWGTDYWPPAWQKWMAPRLPAGMSDAWTDQTVAEGRQAICHHLDVLEDQLGAQAWLAASFSLADVCYAPFVLVLERVDLGEEVARRRRVNNWVARLRERPSVIETMMPPDP